MSVRFEQGDLIRIENLRFPLLVVSKNFFNEAEQAICCPVLQDAVPGPLHIKIHNADVSGTVCCEQLRYFDLRSRGYTRLGSLDLRSVMDITDAVQSIFDYY